ncbi:MAG: PIN domain-containing protein [Thermomicrobiales bacterium]
MPDAPRLLYWDACVFLHWLEGTPAWQPILDGVLDTVKDTPNLFIVTSTVTIVEVAYAKQEKSAKRLDPTLLTAMDEMWSDEAVVRLVEFDRLIARDARYLMRRSVEIPRKLTPLDAVHLATAQRLRVAECQTMDEPMKNWKDLGFQVVDPWVAKPRLPGV